MLGIYNAVFSKSSSGIEKEFEGVVHVDDTVLVNETTISVNSTELNDSKRSDQIKLDLIPTDTKRKLSSDLNLYSTVLDDNITVETDFATDIKVKFNNEYLFCKNCNEYYEEYCTKCGMLICILNGNGLNNRTRKEIPSYILEIKEGLFRDTGVFALKTIPKGVKFGPFTGFSTLESSWRLKGGKFVVHSDKSELLNWMQYVNCARNASDQNLHAFQYEGNLYYSSVCEIPEGEELLVYFGEEYEESLSNGIEMDFMPHIETNAKSVFACTYCCLGFSLKAYLVEHKTICTNGTNGNFEGLVQCPVCKIFLEKKEYLEYHEIYCCKGNAKQCIFPALDDHTLEEKSFSPLTNKLKKFNLTQCKYVDSPKNHINTHYKVQPFSCGICYKRFVKKESLKLHVENIHIANKHKHSVHNTGRQFRCLKCQFKTNCKDSLKSHYKTLHPKKRRIYKCMDCQYKTSKEINLQRHIKAKHLKKLNDFSCMECEYKTNIKSNFQSHMKTIHFKEYIYNCIECKYKTNDKKKFEIHVKTEHLKEYDYICSECEYKTNKKNNFQMHMKTKHLKEYDYNCMECEYKTNDKRHLQIHVKTKHLEEYDYNCLECEYKTNDTTCLKIHMKTKHLKEYNYTCKECEYKTNNKTDLLKHIKVKHLKEYDYNCLECKYKTNNKIYLQIHMKTIHFKEYDYSCMEYEYKTNAKLKLEKHMKTKHLKENNFSME